MMSKARLTNLPRFFASWLARYGLFVFGVCLLISCSSGDNDMKGEQIRIPLIESELSKEKEDTLNSISGHLTLGDIPTVPNRVILTGLPAHRLVSIYKAPPTKTSESRFKSYGSDEYWYDDREIHFMPGLDLLYGYNLLNIVHYDMQKDTSVFFFDHPVLIKSLYYPSFVQDSLDKKPINRNYYLVSVYDADTNRDTLINRADLRRFYRFNADADQKLELIPPDYSAVRSQYDSRNDAMYIFARRDRNRNGKIEEDEPMHIFWFSLKDPQPGKRVY